MTSALDSCIDREALVMGKWETRREQGKAQLPCRRILHLGCCKGHDPPFFCSHPWYNTLLLFAFLVLLCFFSAVFLRARGAYKFELALIQATWLTHKRNASPCVMSTWRKSLFCLLRKKRVRACTQSEKCQGAAGFRVWLVLVRSGVLSSVPRGCYVGCLASLAIIARPFVWHCRAPAGGLCVKYNRVGAVALYYQPRIGHD